MNAPSAVFELDSVQRARAGAPAIGPCSLRIERGGVAALAGPSGSGKSTLLALLAGVESADRGRVLWEGRDVTRASESALALLRRGRIGVVGQSSLLLEHLPVWQGAAIGLSACGVPRRERRTRALAQLEALGIDARLGERLPAHLSGGERQRVCLARALLTAELGLILDEPTSNQDERSAELVIDALRARADRGTAMVIATHDAQLERLADQRLQLSRGEGQ